VPGRIAVGGACGLRRSRALWAGHQGPLPELPLLKAGAIWTAGARRLACMPAESTAAREPTAEPPSEKVWAIRTASANCRLGIRQRSRRENAADRVVLQACPAWRRCRGRTAGACCGHVDQGVRAARSVFIIRTGLGSVPSVLNVNDFKRRGDAPSGETTSAPQPASRFTPLPSPKFVSPSAEMSPRAGAQPTCSEQLDYGAHQSLEQQCELCGVRLEERGPRPAASIWTDRLVSWAPSSADGARLMQRADLQREVPSR